MWIAGRVPGAPRLRWPAVPANAAPARRIAVVPRAWLDARHEGWTCPDEPADDVPCVSRDARPGALVTRVDEGLDARTKTLTDALAAKAIDIAKALGEGGREVTRALETRADAIDATLVQHAEGLDKT